jgi:hypothetical protein
MKGTCLACRKHKELDRAHLKSRGAGAGWNDDEWIALCRPCHSLQHLKGWKAMVDQFAWLLPYLEAKGWQVVEEFGIWRLRKL